MLKKLRNYSKELRYSTIVLIDSFHNHASENKFLANELNEFEVENIFVSSRDSNLEANVLRLNMKTKCWMTNSKKIWEGGENWEIHDLWSEV